MRSRVHSARSGDPPMTKYSRPNATIRPVPVPHSHFEEAHELALKGGLYPAPSFVFNAPVGQPTEDFLPEQLEIRDYESGPYIKLEMAV